MPPKVKQVIAQLSTTVQTVVDNVEKTVKSAAKQLPGIKAATFDWPNAEKPPLFPTQVGGRLKPLEAVGKLSNQQTQGAPHE